MATEDLNIIEAQAKTRFLLALFGMDDLGKEVKKTAVTGRVFRKEKVSTYNPILEAMEGEGTIVLIQKKPYTISLTDVGKQALIEGIKRGDLVLSGTQVGSWVAKALMKLFQQTSDVLNATHEKSSPAAIASYDQFKLVALATYDRLNSDYNYDNLVPIYRIRREIGDRVTRAQFSDWMLEMQANDILQLHTTGIEDNAPDKLEDSIMTKVSGLRCYAKRIN